MSSLTRHLRALDDHGHLPFHPACPVCRAERPHGELPDSGRARTPAGVVALLVASSALAAPPAGAQVPDEMTQPPDGTEETADGTQGEFGEETIDVPDPEPPLPPTAPAPEPPAAPASEPAPPAPPAPQPPPQPPVEPAPPPEAAPPPIGQPPQPPAPIEEATPPVAPPPAAVPPAPAPPSPPPSPPAASPAPPSESRGGGRDQPRRDANKHERWVADVPSNPTVPQSPQPPPPADVQIVSTPEATAAEPAAPRRAVEASGRVHVVSSGESLWSIAAALLGDGASPGQVATMVDRLWSINADRIRSGEPDLIRPGERLILPAASR
jgi:LysM domain